MKRQIAPKRVALLMGQDFGYCRRVLSGILSYVEAHALDWMLRDAQPDIRLWDDLLEWQPDGIIAHLFDRNLADRLVSLGRPLVSITDTLADLPVHHVDVDNRAVGEMAADYLMGLGYRNFAYFGSLSARFSFDRMSGFRDRLADSGYSLVQRDANLLPRPPFGESWSRLDRETAEWLDELPKPVAVLASNDIPARFLCEACRLRGIDVPGGVAILGTDNDASECRMASPALSSIESPAHAIGIRSAEILDSLLKGVKNVPTETTLPPKSLIVRASTEASADLSPQLAKALAFIDEQASRGVDVATVSGHVGMSRRSLERRFRDELQITVHTAILNAQVSHARQLLTETELSIGEIAMRTGFGNPRGLERAFAREVGKSPSAFRKQLRSTV